MFKPVEMFTLICDNCGADYCEESEYSCYGDKQMLLDEAVEENGWEIFEGEKHICERCWHWDDEDNQVINTDRSKQ